MQPSQTSNLPSEDKGGKKWLWFFLTIVMGAIPFIVRAIIADMCDYVYPSYDIKDAVYYGMTINVSNFSLLGNEKFKWQGPVLLISLFFIMVLCLFIGILQYHECQHGNPDKLNIVNLITLALVGISILISASANFNVINRSN